jgi:hypothetical protein
MKIQITIGDQRFQATLTDSAAGRDLITQLPLTLKMVDHGSVEKTGPLPAPLSLDGQPDGAGLPRLGPYGAARATFLRVFGACPLRSQAGAN